jgi:NodT family efflux transporter outer membrane factor (OMF) lipoprotein
LFEKVTPRDALRQSAARAHGHRRTLLGWIVAWALSMIVLSTLATCIIGLLGRLLVPSSSDSLRLLTVTVGVIMLLGAIANLLINVLGTTTFATLLCNLYLDFGKDISTDSVPIDFTDESSVVMGFQITSKRLFARVLVGTFLAVFVGTTALHSVGLEDKVKIMAHRASSKAAPENTMAAFRKAIDDGADWIELDVQETADGEVVVLHDSNFMKMAGVDLKIWNAKLPDLKDIDIGGWFAPEFKEERATSLADVLLACKGKICVNIELKYYGHDEQLEQRVANIVEACGMTSEVMAMSLKMEGVRKMKALRPDWKVGLLLSVSVGNLDKLEADFLAINAGFADRKLIRAAHHSKREVYVWTVNDAPTMSAMISRGVDGILTDKPDLARSVLEQRAQMSVPERLLLEVAAVLGTVPAIAEQLSQEACEISSLAIASSQLAPAPKCQRSEVTEVEKTDAIFNDCASLSQLPASTLPKRTDMRIFPNISIQGAGMSSRWEKPALRELYIVSSTSFRLRKTGLPCQLAGLLLVLFCGCTPLPTWVSNGFQVGPDYLRPAAPVADNWIDYADNRTEESELQLRDWWRTFNDPALNALVDTAYQQNLSLRVAGARILEARAKRGIAAGNLWPQVQEMVGDYSRNKLSSVTANPPNELWFSNWEGGVNLAWELDFWGRFRRAIEASDAELDASVENYDDVLVILLSDVAANYVRFRTFQERLTYAHTNVEIQAKSLQLAQDKFNQGAATERDVEQARQVLEQTRALIPELEIGKRQANNALCILMGLPPRDLQRILGDTGVTPTAPKNVAIGIPADLIRRRPDLRRAEREVAAQSARIGIAEADFYPRFSLIGSLGVQSEQLGDLFDTPASMAAGVAPAFQWNILNYGRIVNGVRVQDARFQQLAFAYQNAVLSAGREAEDAIVVYTKSQDQVSHLSASVDAATRTYEITIDQYRLGAVDFTPVFIFQTTLTQQQDQLAFAKGNVALGLVELYRSLGGGWEIRLNGPEYGGNMQMTPLPVLTEQQPVAEEVPAAKPDPAQPLPPAKLDPVLPPPPAKP